MTSFEPVSPADLAVRLADWADGLAAERPRVGLDGDPAWGTAELAEQVAARLGDRGRPAVAVSTRWWWRPASLRLELGRQDRDMLRHGWVDGVAVERELTGPWARGGTYLPRLRDPDTDRSVRDPARPVPPRGVLVVHGPFLRDLPIDLDGWAGLAVSAAAARRRLPPDRQWWAGAFADYAADSPPAHWADLLVSYDHPRSPALAILRPARPAL